MAQARSGSTIKGAQQQAKPAQSAHVIRFSDPIWQCNIQEFGSCRESCDVKLSSSLDCKRGGTKHLARTAVPWLGQDHAMGLGPAAARLFVPAKQAPHGSLPLDQNGWLRYTWLEIKIEEP